MLKILQTLVFLFFLCQVQAQEVQINEETGITRLMNAWVSSNRATPKVEGWRVQVMSGTDRRLVEEGRNKFRLRYSEVPADWVHEKPYYKLRVGAFRSKQEALTFISTLSEYPGAYPVKDINIHPRDFLEP